jgi:HAD superfamily hydrolase (TIGR01549 family)
MPSPEHGAALVDLDGTLVDSNYHHAIAWSRALRDHGERSEIAAIHRSIGMGSSEMLQRLIGRADDAIVNSWRAHFESLLPEIVAFDRAAALLQALRDIGLRVVIATSSPEDLVRELLGRVGPADLIDVVVSSADVERAKPEPDVFAAAADKAGVHGSRVMALGDSVWDAYAARRAGLRCTGLECGGTSAAELKAAGAVAVFRNPADVLENIAQSPFPGLG